MPTVFVSGANRGLGLEFTRQYAADGWTVIATCRNPIAPGELASLAGDIRVHGLDVGDPQQVRRLADDLSGTAIDVLINNAGIYGPRDYSPGDVDLDAWAEVFHTNTMAPLIVADAFTPHVAAGDHKKIANVSSKMGSIGDNTSAGAYIYCSSKAALNSVMKNYADAVHDLGIAVTVMHPGWVQTDMGSSAADIDATESVTGMRQVIDNLSRATTGRFYNYDGAELSW